MGASACYYLAANGASVLGIEQFDLPHEYGSHAGQSRIVRKAYFEHPDYVPLLQRAYHNWEHLESVTNEQVFYKTGLLYAGPKDHPILRGVQSSSEAYGIPIDVDFLTGQSSSYAAIKLPQRYDCIFEPDAGFVTPEKAIRLYAGQAKASGATILTNTKVLAWKEEDNAFEVQTTAGNFLGRKLVFSSGAWTSALLPTLPVPVHVTRQVLAWVKPTVPDAVELG
jgi:sarcosine oxidase